MYGSDLIVVRGGNDIASGIIHRLTGCGYNVLVLEGENPAEVRRKVAFCEAVFEGEIKIEGVSCTRVADLVEAELMFKMGKAALIIDENCDILRDLKPKILIDARLDNKASDKYMGMADYTMAVGTGFFAGRDVDCVIESARGHRLGSVIYSGYAMPDSDKFNRSSILSTESVIHAPQNGEILNVCEIGDTVKSGQVIAKIGYTDILSPVNGILRGIIRDNYKVTRGMKIAEAVSGFFERESCFTISDRARCISGSVLEETVKFFNRNC